MKKKILLAVVFVVGLAFASLALQTNFDRLVLGEANFGSDPNPTADITGQNDEYLSNYVDGEWSVGSAALNVGSTIAGIDSFASSTSITSDTLAISGVAVGDIFTFSEYTPAWSTALDSVTFSYRTKTDTVFVTRTSTLGTAGTVYKAYGLYSYIRLK